MKRDDNDIVFTSEELDALKETFYAHALELHEQLGDEVLRLESAGYQPESMTGIKRLLHTLKGDSSSIGLKGLAELIHGAEDFIAALEERALDIDAGTAEVLFDVADEIKKAVEADRNGLEYPCSPSLKARMESGPARPYQSPEREARPGSATPAPEQPVKKAAAMVRVQSEKLDELMDLVGELVTGRSMLEQLIGTLEASHPEDELLQGFLKAKAFIARSLTDLQKSVLTIRMVSVHNVLKRFPRLVRDYCRASGKEIDLVLRGEDTELDKALVEMMAEPLLHIVRNAIDHGIEEPEKRLEAGKPRHGTVIMEASHHDGEIAVTVSDDGRGIDTERLKAKAIEHGLKTPNDIAAMDESELTELIFLPGLSTSDAVNGVSGRGIGMDIVRSSVEAMRGSVIVASSAGKGTVFTLRFPMTLSIIKAVLVRTDGRLYALPIGSVAEIKRIRQCDIEKIAGKDFLRIRGLAVPLISLSRRDGEDAAWFRRRKAFAIVLRHGERRIGLAVEGLLGEREILVKSIDEEWLKTRLVSGASILGNGNIVLLFNVSELVSRSISSEEQPGNLRAAAN